MRSWRLAAAALPTGILLASVWASGWPRFTWTARIGTFGCALAILTVGRLCRWPRGTPAPVPGPRPRSPAPAGDLLWLGVVVAAVAWDVLGLLTPPHRAHLTLSTTELTYRPLHAALFACWLALGLVLAGAPVRRKRRSRP